MAGLLLSGMGIDPATDAARTQPESLAPQILQLGHNMPVNSPLHQAAQRLASALKQATHQQLQIQIYPLQQLGNDQQMLEQVRQGKLDLLLIPTAKLGTTLPALQYPDLPFYFPTPEDLYHLLDGEPGQILLQQLKRIDLVGLAFWGNGFKQLTANRPLLYPADFSGQRLRIMKSRLLQEQFKLLDAETLPIDFHQLRKALHDHVVDGQENPLIAIHSMGIHEVQSDLTLTQHAYLAYVMVANQHRWQQLTPNQRTQLQGIVRQLTPWQRQQTAQQDRAILQELRQQKQLHIHTLTSEQRQIFRHRLQPLVQRFKQHIAPQLMALTDAYLRQKYSAPNSRFIQLCVDLSGPQAIGVDSYRGATLALEHWWNPAAYELIPMDQRINPKCQQPQRRLHAPRTAALIRMVSREHLWNPWPRGYPQLELPPLPAPAVLRQDLYHCPLSAPTPNSKHLGSAQQATNLWPVVRVPPLSAPRPQRLPLIQQRTQADSLLLAHYQSRYGHLPQSSSAVLQAYAGTQALLKRLDQCPSSSQVPFL